MTLTQEFVKTDDNGDAENPELFAYGAFDPLEASRQHTLISWSANNPAAHGKVIDRAEGVYFYETNGTRYLDFSSQLINSNLGHQHPKVVAAIQEQAAKLCYISSGFSNTPRALLSQMLAEVAPGDLNRVFFTNGGAEAIEHAVKFARAFTGRNKVITRYRSYHGATAAAMMLGGDNRRWANEPGVAIPGVVRVHDTNAYHCRFCKGPGAADCNLGCADNIEDILYFEGPESVAAILVEPISGTNGVLVPHPDYLRRLRDICDRYGILLMCDEVMTGFGRTGTWFGCQNFGVVPDIITFAKGVNCGYVPLGGVIVSERIAKFFDDKPLVAGATYSGHPLACAAGVATLQVYKEENLIERSRVMGEKLGEKLRALQAKHPSVGDVRGMGLFYAVELVKNRETREMLVRWNGATQGVMNRLKAEMMARGVFLFGRYNIFFVAPPLIITEEQIDFGIAALDEVLTIADAEVITPSA